MTAYLQAVTAIGSASDGRAVVARIRQTSWFEDSLFGHMRLREDGTLEHPMYLVEVKTQQASHYAWGFYTILSQVLAELVFQPQSETGCQSVGH